MKSSRQYAVIISESVQDRPAVDRLQKTLRRLGLLDVVSLIPIMSNGVIVDALDGDEEVVAFVTRNFRSNINDKTVMNIEGGFPIFNLSSGVDHIRFKDQFNIDNFPIYRIKSAQSVSQLAFNFLQNHYQNLQENTDRVKRGLFSTKTMTESLSHKVHTLYGKGQIVRDMVKLLSAAGIKKIKVWSPYFSNQDKHSLRASLWVPNEFRTEIPPYIPSQLNDLQELAEWQEEKLEFTNNIFNAAECHSASIHHPYEESGFYHGWPNGSLFTKNYLRHFNDAVLINVARGEHVDEQDVLNSLENGSLAAYYADVINKRAEATNNIKNSPIWEAFAEDSYEGRLGLTQHIGNFSTEFESECNRMMSIIARRIYMSETAFAPGAPIEIELNK